MKNAHFFKYLLLFSLGASALLFSCEKNPDPDLDKDKVRLTAAERELYQLIMEYRKELGLAEIPLSASLTFVAQTHVKDLEENNPKTATCNLHSWSDQGDWTACCYTSDHAQASCMWNKPRELSSYPGNGYELGYATSAQASPLAALNAWKNSSGHNAVLTNAGSWSATWKAIGIGIKGGHAVVWLGREDDPAGPAQ